jgi:hypothetical protein
MRDACFCRGVRGSPVKDFPREMAGWYMYSGIHVGSACIGCGLKKKWDRISHEILGRRNRPPDDKKIAGVILRTITVDEPGFRNA